MLRSCGVGAKSEAVLPWRVPVWQQGPPHSNCTSLSWGGASGLQCWDRSQVACKRGMSSEESGWSWNGGPTDLSRTQLRGFPLSCERHSLAGATTWDCSYNPGVTPPPMQPWNLLMEGKWCTWTSQWPSTSMARGPTGHLSPLRRMDCGIQVSSTGVGDCPRNIITGCGDPC